MYISLFTVAINVNYASEFWELFEAIMYIRQSLRTCLVLYCLYIQLVSFTGALSRRKKKPRENVFASILAITSVKNEISFLLKSWEFYVLNFRNMNIL
jgi:hypothetical protein